MLRLFILSCLLLTSCLEKNSEVSAPSKVSTITAGSFLGVKSVVNKGGALLVSWDAPNASVKSFNIYRGYSALSMSLIGNSLSSDSSYLDSSAVAGQVYAYKVKAVDSNDIEDANNSIVFGISYPGIYQAFASGKSNITVSLPYVVGAIDSVYLFAQPLSGGPEKKFGPYATNNINITLTGLRSGATYNVRAEAYVADRDLYDGNTNTIKTKTDSFSFSGDFRSDYAYRGFINIKSFGDAPGAPQDSFEPSRLIPRTRMISLKALAFEGYRTSKYKFVRIEESSGKIPDVTSLTVCSESVTFSCVPSGCGSVDAISYQGVSSVSCDDTTVAPPPAKYYYAVTMIRSDADGTWPEELPDSSPGSVVVKVQVPPDNMVLTHRDAANYEMCYNMARVSDPKAHQRCAYSGMGATTLDRGPGTNPLNLDPNYYDFGYNLFVDRWEMACNWTTQASGGMCGPGGTPGNCIGMKSPEPDVGVNGNVYSVINFVVNRYNSTAATYIPRCLIKKNGAWIGPDVLTTGIYSDIGRNPSPILSVKPYQSDPDMVTNDPSAQGGFRSAYNRVVNSETAQGFCQGKIDINYGKKRIPRTREFRVFAAEEWLPGETDKTSADIRNILNPSNSANIGHRPGNWACNSDLPSRARNAANFPAGFPNWNGTTNLDFPATLEEMLDPIRNITGIGTFTDRSNALNNEGNGVALYFIGSLGTSHCVSRFGVQDAIGNAAELSSDQYRFLTLSGSQYLTGVVNPYDSTNLDVAGFQFGTDGIDPTVTNQNNCCNGVQTSFGISTAYSNVIVPLGLMTKVPMNGSLTNSNFRSLLGLNSNQHFIISGYLSAPVFSQNNGGAAGNALGRWTTLLSSQQDQGFRCVLPADE